MLLGAAIHHWFLTGLAAVSFLFFVKAIVAPHLPAGAQRAIAAL